MELLACLDDFCRQTSQDVQGRLAAKT